MGRIKTEDMELAIAWYFNFTRHLIVPNVSFGLKLHECDLLILTNSGYAYEIEIKTSLHDLRRDLNKKHGHKSKRIKYLYFAIPENLIGYVKFIPDRAGILVVGKNSKGYSCRLVRKPEANKPIYKFSTKERYKLARLGTIRIWTLKNKIRKIKRGKRKKEKGS
jgi:hypothetical protein